MAAGVPIDPELQRLILERHAEGLSRNAIGRELGIDPSTVGKYVREAGGTFDRTATEAATKARQADLLDRRSQLELAYLDDAERLRLEVWKPRAYKQVVGGMDGPRVVEYELDTPGPADQLKLMQASTTAAAASQKIADAQVDRSAAEAKSMLVTLFDGLERAYREVQSQDLSQPGDSST